jgi:G2/mitotic-specific cyclin 3/4
VLSQKGAHQQIIEKDAYKSAKGTTQPQPTRPAALLRPAQRSLSTVSSKSSMAPILPNAMAVNTDVNPQQGRALPPTATDPLREVSNTRKSISKRQTTIFRESDPTSSTSSNEARKTSSASAAPVHQSLAVSAVQTSTQIDTQKALPDLPLSEEQATNGVSLLPPEAPRDQDQVKYPHAGPVTAEPFPQLEAFPQLPEINLQPEYPEARLHEPYLAAVEPLLLLNEEKEVFLPALETQYKSKKPMLLEQAPKTAPADAVEYWDDDEEVDDEYFDAEGYTTGRSFRSKGDNTTGGMTTLIAPKVTIAVKKELDAARIYVEANRTDEDIEDEMFDQSMVAEYGDEIFAYMRELEVSRYLVHFASHNKLTRT